MIALAGLMGTYRSEMPMVKRGRPVPTVVDARVALTRLLMYQTTHLSIRPEILGIFT